MSLINLRRTVGGISFGQDIFVTRISNSWEAGRITKEEKTFRMTAIVTNAKESELNQLPEGDFPSGIMVFKTTEPLYKTNSTDTSDIVFWNNKHFKIIADADSSGYGFYKYFGAYITE